MIVVNQMVVKLINVVKFMNVFRVQTKLQRNIYISKGMFTEHCSGLQILGLLLLYL